LLKPFSNDRRDDHPFDDQIADLRRAIRQESTIIPFAEEKTSKKN